MSLPARRSSVWAVADQPSGVQRQGRYLPAAIAHPGKMLPALARQAIEIYSQPGQLVLDPMCGIGTTLLEAVHLDRHAIGVELEQRWATLAAANLNHARGQGATGHGLALRGDARQLGRGLLDDYCGQVALILTSPPYGPSLHGHVRKTAGRVVKFNDRYSRNPDNLAHLPSQPGRQGRPSFDVVLAEILAGCQRMLSPEGRLVMTVRPYRHAGRLINLPAQLEQLAACNGLALCDRHAALLCGLNGRRLVPRASFFQIQIQRSERFPRMLIIAHEDVLVFRPKTSSVGSRKLKSRQKTGRPS